MSSIHWMLVTVLFSLLLWLPYVTERTLRRGLFNAIGNPPAEEKDVPEWARRSAAVHRNASENVPYFVAVVLAAAALGKADAPMVILGTQVFLAGRVVHAIAYTAGIPGVRTLGFFGAWAAMFGIGLTLLLG